jgi:hypothetical protein
MFFAARKMRETAKLVPPTLDRVERLNAMAAILHTRFPFRFATRRRVARFFFTEKADDIKIDSSLPPDKISPP